MNATFVETWDELDAAERGAVMACIREDEVVSLVARCPGCGEMTTIDLEDQFKLTGFPTLPTLDAPVRHSCGWSGKLTNGVWK